jgi:hypothetical protein
MNTSGHHRYSINDQSCECGGAWVYHDDLVTYGCEHVKPTDGVERDYLGRVVKPSKRTSGREIPVDPERLEWFFDREEEDPLLPEGKATFSWEKLSQRDNRNEGWGHENPGHRRRRRRYEGD